MSAGIYRYKGNYAYSLNLEKKLKRRKEAEIIEQFDEPVTEEFLKDHLKTYEILKNKEEVKDSDLKYHFFNPITKETILSIYPDLNNIPNIKSEEWKLI